MRFIKISFLLFILTLFRTVGYSQQSSTSYKPTMPVIPPSPEAASLGKFGEIPVSLYSGIPSISVPVYVLAINGFSLPISLDYHAGGIKVDEISSSVGLGWALNAGGVISCKVNGTADRTAAGVWNRTMPANVNTFNPNLYDGTPGNPYANDFNLAGLATDPHPSVDLLPDEFFYNFVGKSGKIVFDENQVARTVPFDPIKITGLFSVTDENGVKFDFNSTEKTSSQVTCTPTQSRPSPNPHISSYYLTKITTPKGDFIDFTYTPQFYSCDQSWTEAGSIVIVQSGCGTDPLKSYCKNKTTIDGVRLTSISSSNGITVNFNYDTVDRLDLPGTNRLKSITIFDKDGNQKSFTLTHSTFAGNRLKLDAVLEAGKKPYSFDYIESTHLPARLSKAQDHWGFYNGAASNLGLIPTQSFTVNNVRYQFNGANREPNESYVSFGTLNKITYQTGGFSVFEYESNRYFSSAPEVVVVKHSIGVNAGVYDANNNGNRGIGNLTQLIDNTTFPDFIDGKCTEGASPIVCPKLTWNLPDPSCHYTVSVIDPDNNGSICCNGQASGQILLPSIKPGTWQFHVNISNCDVGASADITLSWADKHVVGPFSNPIAGGLRIKSIKNYTDENELAGEKSFEYVLKDDPTKSSGSTVDVPKYNYNYIIYNPTVQMSPGGFFSLNVKYGPIINFCQYYGLTSMSAEPLGGIKGGSVGYTDVTIYDKGVIANGKTYNKFKFVSDLKAPPKFDLNELLSQMEYTSYDFLRGLPEETIVYKSLPDLSYSPIKRTTYDYEVRHNPASFWGYQSTGEAANEKNIIGIRIAKVFEYGSNNTPAYGFYYIKQPSIWYSLSKKTEYVYQPDDISSQLSTETNFYYDNPLHAQVSRQTNKNNFGQIVYSHTLYPDDYSNSNGFVYDMQQAHIFKPIEFTNYRTDENGSNSVILSSVLNTYKGGSQAGFLEGSFLLKNASPIDKANFRFSNQTQYNKFPNEGAKSNFNLASIDTHYPALPDYTYEYDGNKNIATVQKNNDVASSFIWGYDNAVVIAKVSNAAQNQIAYTSFENQSSIGGWNFTYDLTAVSSTIHKTGAKSYFAGQSISKSGLPQGNYIVSFWTKANNGSNSGGVNVNGQQIIVDNASWVYQEVVLNNVTSVSIDFSLLNGPNGISIDELRLYPKNARMNTYTYGPLMGLTSETDPNNQTMFYEYDASGRLKTILDNDSNIVKNYFYNYRAR